MISIIIVLFNSQRYIDRCIEKIKQSYLNNINYEIILFNNQCDITYKHYESDRNIKFIVSEINIGYTAAINKAISHSSGDCILLINPDVFVENKCIFNLYQTYINDNKTIVGGKGMTENNEYHLSSKRMFPYFRVIIRKLFYNLNDKFTNPYNYKEINVNQECQVDTVSGACMMFSKDIFTKLNGFDERFFMFFEDTDFCLRAKNNNVNITYNPLSSYIHIKGGSVNNENNIFVKINFYKSMIQFIIKYYYQYKLFLLFLSIVVITIINNI